MREPDLELLQELAGAALAAYHDRTVVSTVTDTQVLVTAGTARPDGSGLDRRAGDSPPYLAVAFRGTDDFRKALHDAEIELMGAPDLPAQSGRLHRGVCRAVESVIDQLAEVCRRAPGPIYFTGHSFGGGCAPLAAYLLAQEGIQISGVITFAGMRFADPVFAAKYDALLGDRTWRVVAQGDVVPHLPLPGPNLGWALPYRHVGNEIYLTAESAESAEKIQVKVNRPFTAVLLADGYTIYKAWRVLRNFPVDVEDAIELPEEIVRAHAMSRYDALAAGMPAWEQGK